MTASIFEIFKIVLGIIIASFFLFFMLQIAGIYSFTESRSTQVTEYKNVKKLIEDTYVYSVQSEIDLKKPPIFYTPPYISEADAISVSPSILYFFKPGKRLVVYKSSMDYGFWKADFIAALPESKVFYNLVEYDLDHYSLLHNLTELFPQSVDPKVEFGFCNGGQELVAKSRDEFLKPIRGIVRTKSPQDLGLQFCTVNFSEPKTKIVLTRNSEADPSNNTIFIQLPQNRIGAIMFRGTDKEEQVTDYRLVYKDSLDIFSAIIGGVDSYKYKNKLQFESLLAFSKEESKRATLLASTYSNPELGKQKCAEQYTVLKTKMDGEFKAFLASVINFQNYNNSAEMEKFLNLMDEVNGIYSKIKTAGCD